MPTAEVQASPEQSRQNLRYSGETAQGSPEPPLLAHTSSESRQTFRQKARSLGPLNGWACAVKICLDGMLEDANSHDAPQLCSGFVTITIMTWLLVFGHMN